MKNKKAYKIALNQHEFYNGYDYLRENDQKELRKDLKELNGIKLKEFNNRAIIKPVDNGYILQSYYTEVCKYIDGTFYKTWQGYSATTLKHINIFREYLGLSSIGKHEWIMLETSTN